MSQLPRDTLKTLFVACDHAGLSLKEELQKALPELPWRDLGTFSNQSVDYPDYADALCLALEKQPGAYGVLICGSGQGMCMRANRYPFVRAALCATESAAQLARAHNDANVLCLGGRVIDSELAGKVLVTFLSTAFAGERHTARVAKLGAILKKGTSS